MKPLPTYQKLRGGYYTPKPIADFLARWAIRSPNVQVLEPSCGDGELLEAAIKTLIDCGVDSTIASSQIHGVEIEPEEASKALARVRAVSGLLLPSTEIHIGDFFSYCKDHLTEKRLFDVVIGNPPFIRYQNFPEEHRSVAFELMQSAGLHPSRLTNAWVPFLVATTLLLNDHGRMAMVIPAELLQVNYAAELRFFLSEYYRSITLVTFRKLVFAGIQQEIVLLLGERNGVENTGIRAVELDGVDDLVSSFSLFSDRPLKEMDHSTEKWTMYFLDEKELQFIRELRTHPQLIPAKQVIDVDVGIVTGLNQFFVLDNRQVAHYELQSYSQTIVGRSAHLQGAIFFESDWTQNADSQVPAYLINFPDVPLESLPETAKTYVLEGESNEVNKGYKCRIRKHWYVVPSVWIPDAFMLRQVHNYPKLILNKANATCTDTIHRVRFRNDTNAETIVAVFLNSLTFAFSEITGRSYGGGVLELEPNEAERLPLPLINTHNLDLVEIDRLVRKGNIYEVLGITDQLLLKEGLGLSGKEITQIRNIWEKLRDRRNNRKH